MLSSSLTVKYLILFGIVMKNWLPSADRWRLSKRMYQLLFASGHNIKSHFGQLIFDHVSAHGLSGKGNLSIGFPSLIYESVILHFSEMVVVEVDLSKGHVLLLADPRHRSSMLLNDLDVLFPPTAPLPDIDDDRQDELPDDYDDYSDLE